MPISFSESEYLYDLCWKIKPKWILDSGSGFSSFVFRKYQTTSRRDVRVITIDNNQQWLDKTKSFLIDCGLFAGEMYIINRFMKYQNWFTFDLILEDYDYTKRFKRLMYDMSVLNKTGILILDDAQIRETVDMIYKIKKKYFAESSLLKELKDLHGRYPAIIRKTKEASK